VLGDRSGSSPSRWERSGAREREADQLLREVTNRRGTTLVLVVQHPCLGTLMFDHEVAAWRTVVTTQAGPIGFRLGGEGARTMG
jgi:hypothetical protein